MTTGGRRGLVTESVKILKVTLEEMQRFAAQMSESVDRTAQRERMQLEAGIRIR